MNKRLYLFTARYPYIGVENFLEDEIKFLSKEFDIIYVIPYKRTADGCREMPANCELLEPIVKGKYDFIKHCLFSWAAFKALIADFFAKRVFGSSKRFKVWMTAYLATNSILNSTVVKNISKEINTTDVCYFYWGKWSNVLSVFWKGKAHFVSRFHGQWDLWEEEYDNYAPLRSRIADALDAAVFISEKGRRYFHELYPECNTRLFRLGTKDVGIVNKSTDEKIRVLSCSTVYPLKRVDLILKSVVEMAKTQKVEWAHLGGGEDYEAIKDQAEQAQNEHLKINMAGQMSYKDVLTYYKNNPFDVFVNLSTNEGIPVSIMEAASCDVPTVATNVGGTSEIVNKETGELVSENPTPEEVASKIIEVFNHRENYNPREFWLQNYVAEKNYMQYSKFLASISE